MVKLVLFGWAAPILCLFAYAINLIRGCKICGNSVLCFFFRFFFDVSFFAFPLDVQHDELVQTESFHVVVIDDVQAKVQQVLGIAVDGSQQRADVQFQLVQYRFVDDSGAVNELLEEGIFFDGIQMFF